MKPQQISMWGNDVHGDCVTAEEAFAKACNNPEIFIPDAEVIAWATKHGVLEGANLTEVMTWMQNDGFAGGAAVYDDGPHFSVNWTDAGTLQNAISSGPVKIGVAADQIETAWRTTSGRTGWFGTGWHADSAEDHCVTLCGYGSLSWLAQQLGVQVPAGVNGAEPGYAMFTWNTIGIVDAPSMTAITHEAWLRQPTTVTKTATLAARPKTPINVLARYPEHLDVFAAASDGRTMSVWWDASGGWAGWFQVSGGIASPGGAGSPITAVNRYSTHLDLFTVGTDNRAYSAWWDAASGWSSWFTLGSLQCRPGSTINVVSRYSDHLDLFTTASDGRTMSTYWDARTGWAPDWFQVSGGVAAAGSAVTAVARHPSHLDLFTVGTDNRVYSCWWDDRSGWAQWFPLNGITCSPDSVVTVISRHPDHLDLFTTAANGAIMSTWWDTRSGWGQWFQVSGGVASPGSPVTAIARYSNHIDLFVTGTDDHIYSTWWDSASGWAPWFNVSGGVGEPGGQTAAISRFDDHIDLFTVGTDGLVYSTYWDASTGWAGWFQLG
jgi:hypothetical protein